MGGAQSHELQFARGVMESPQHSPNHPPLRPPVFDSATYSVVNVFDVALQVLLGAEAKPAAGQASGRPSGRFESAASGALILQRCRVPACEPTAALRSVLQPAFMLGAPSGGAPAQATQQARHRLHRPAPARSRSLPFSRKNARAGPARERAGRGGARGQRVGRHLGHGRQRGDQLARAGHVLQQAGGRKGSRWARRRLAAEWLSWRGGGGMAGRVPAAEPPTHPGSKLCCGTGRQRLGRQRVLTATHTRCRAPSTAPPAAGARGKRVAVVTVLSRDGEKRTLDAVLVGADKARDLAVLRVRGERAGGVASMRAGTLSWGSYGTA
jgi:hypothetical protein